MSSIPTKPAAPLRRRARRASAAESDAWRDAVDDSPVFDDELAVHYDEWNTFRVLRRVRERRAVRDSLGIEDRDIGVRAGLQSSLRLDSEPLRGHEAHLAQSVHQRERPLLADVATEHASESPGATRMTFAVLEHAVAGDDHGRIGHCEPGHLFRDAMNDRHAALLAVARKRLGSKALAGQRPLQI